MSTNREQKSQMCRNLKTLRLEKGLNQQELAIDFSKFIGKGKIYSLTTISAWEVGRKTPSLETLYHLARYFNVSLDFLCGETMERNGKKDALTLDEKSIEERDIIIQESKLKLSVDEYQKYDGLPVFVEFKDMERKNTWGLLDYENKQIVTLKERFAISKYNVSLYAYQLPYEMFFDFWKIHAYSLQQVMSASMFWVEVYSSDDMIKGQYNGWYKHNENKTCIINCNNALTLPYTGLNVSYCVYSSPKVNS